MLTIRLFDMKLLHFVLYYYLKKSDKNWQSVEILVFYCL